MENIQFDYGVPPDTIDKEIKSNDSTNKESKYGDDELFEPWADINIFFPVGFKLVDPLYNLGLTPNMVTILSTTFTFLSIYYLHLNSRLLAFGAYLIGYMLDCVDGRMARKYSLGSDLGMALDCTSDNVSNLILIIYILLTRQINWVTGPSLFIIAIMSFLLSLSYGLNEAIAIMKKFNTDNFYENKVKQLEEKGTGLKKWIFKLFLFITKTSYQTYRLFFPEYNEDKIFNWLKILKHFGPGNYCLLVGLILLFI
jgi:phosphatidylglycerophosphate synthase